MVADYMTKPLTGTKFMLFRRRLLNIWTQPSLASRSVLKNPNF
jgi:hypothetical protein